jgi:hypothetical protein
MADGYLEQHQRDYEARKEAWLRKKKHQPDLKYRAISRPDDEAL